MLAAINGQIDLSITEVFRFVIRQKQHSTISNPSAYLGAVASLLLTADDLFIEICSSCCFFAVNRLLVRWERYMGLLGHLIKLLKLHLILISLVYVWRERHLCLIKFIKHDRWLYATHLSHLKASLVNSLLVNPGVSRILDICCLIELGSLLSST